MNWSVRQGCNKICSTIDIVFHRSSEWEQWALLTSDRHIDHPHSDHRMQIRHLEQAKERNAFVIDTGDCICGMQGKSDRRHRKQDVKEGLQSDDYVGELIRYGFEFFEPYKEILAVQAKGNHELGLRKHLEIDVIRAICERLRDNGSQVRDMGFRGWTSLRFKGGHYQQSIAVYWTHGSGGAAPVTKGVIRSNRRSVTYPGADIVLSGHIHEGWSFPIQQIELTQNGVERKKEQLHLALPTYKDEVTNCADGFAAENEHNPKPIGAWWLRFFWDGNRVAYDYMRAQ